MPCSRKCKDPVVRDLDRLCLTVEISPCCVHTSGRQRLRDYLTQHTLDIPVLAMSERALCSIIAREILESSAGKVTYESRIIEDTARKVMGRSVYSRPGRAVGSNHALPMLHEVNTI